MGLGADIYVYYLFTEMKVVNGPILITFATPSIFLK